MFGPIEMTPTYIQSGILRWACHLSYFHFLHPESIYKNVLGTKEKNEMIFKFQTNLFFCFLYMMEKLVNEATYLWPRTVLAMTACGCIQCFTLQLYSWLQFCLNLMVTKAPNVLTMWPQLQLRLFLKILITL